MYFDIQVPHLAILQKLHFKKSPLQPKNLKTNQTHPLIMRTKYKKRSGSEENNKL